MSDHVYQSTFSLKVKHNGMSDEQFTRMMRNIIKATVGRSKRKASLVCGEHTLTSNAVWCPIPKRKL